MTIFFPDVSHYQAGLTIKPGTVVVIAKASEGTGYYDPSYWDFAAQAASVGAVFVGYHYLRQETSASQQAVFAHNRMGSTPAMLDVEANSGGVGQVCAFIDSYRALGGVMNLVYLPHWYWNNIGSPSLTPLTNRGVQLVSSNYTTYSDNGPGWIDYGGCNVAQWQYSDNQYYNGMNVDFNAYKGTVNEYRALVGYPLPPPVEDKDMSVFSQNVLPKGFDDDDLVLNKSWAPGAIYLSTDYGKSKVRVAIHTANVGYTSAKEYVLSNADPNHLDIQLPQNTDRVTISRVPIDASDLGKNPVTVTLYQPVFL